MVKIEIDFFNGPDHILGEVSSVSGAGNEDIGGIPFMWHIDLYQWHKPPKKSGVYHWGRLEYIPGDNYFECYSVSNRDPTPEDLVIVDKINDIMREYFHLY